MKVFRSHIIGLTLLASMAGFMGAAVADKGDFQVRLRGIAVIPSESSSITNIGGTAEVDASFAPEVDFSYFISNNVAVEVIAATTKHNVKATGTTLGTVDLGSVWVLPPTVTLQYHFSPNDAIRPYIGAGFNYTVFWKENAPGLDLTYEDRFGFALQAGVDVPLNDDVFFNVDLKKIFLDTEVNVANGVAVADVDLNPFVVGIGFGKRF